MNWRLRRGPLNHPGSGIRAAGASVGQNERGPDAALAHQNPDCTIHKFSAHLPH